MLSDLCPLAIHLITCIRTLFPPIAPLPAVYARTIVTSESRITSLAALSAGRLRVVVPIIWNADRHCCFSDTLLYTAVNVLVRAVLTLTPAQASTVAHLPSLNTVSILANESGPACSVQALPRRTVICTVSLSLTTLPDHKEWEQD